MAVARICAAAAATLAAAAVAAACWLMTLPREETWFFAPRPFNGSAFVVGCGLLALVWAITGAVVVSLRPRNALGWVVLGVGVSQAWAVGLTAYSGYGLLESSPGWAAYFGPALYLPGWLIPPTVLLALYPDGRLPSKHWRWPVGAAVLSIVVLTLCIPFPVVAPAEVNGWGMVPRFPQRLVDVLVPGPRVYDVQVFLSADPTATIPVAPLSWARWSSIGSWVFKPLLVVSMLTIWVGTVRRMVQARPPRRQQLALLVCVVMPFLAASLFVSVTFANVLILLSLLLVPVAVAVGVLRYRLLGIEAVLRRGLVYGMYTCVVVAVYLAVTAAAGAAVGAALDSRPLPGVVAAAAVAVALAPARDRLQRAADRLVYGQRRDPLEALTLLGQRVAVTGQGDLLADALHAVTAAVRAPGATLTAPDGRVLAQVGAAPAGGGQTTDLPLRFGGTLLGELRVSARRPGETYTPADARLLAALALQVAVVLQAFQLTEQLEAERDRVVTAAESERERLRADLHDGLGPSLSGIGLGLQALVDSADDPLLRRIRDEVGVAFADVRRILDNLRPAALDTMPLPDAIRRHAQTFSGTVPVDVMATDLPSIPAEVENAAYRITTEALTNAARHAQATQIRVSLAAPNGSLRITVADDGCGTASAIAGIGLTSMRRRAEQLGGRLDLESGAAGTVVTAVLPFSLAQPAVLSPAQAAVLSAFPAQPTVSPLEREEL
jgi:signal transduction histidine kinase